MGHSAIVNSAYDELVANSSTVALAVLVEHDSSALEPMMAMRWSHVACEACVPSLGQSYEV